MLFTNNGAHYFDLSYMEYFYDLEMVSNFAWEAATPTYILV